MKTQVEEVLGLTRQLDNCLAAARYCYDQASILETRQFGDCVALAVAVSDSGGGAQGSADRIREQLCRIGELLDTLVQRVGNE
jgi:hypothetical protein